MAEVLYLNFFKLKKTKKIQNNNNKKTSGGDFLTHTVDTTGGTLRFHGTLVEEHCYKVIEYNVLFTTLCDVVD